MLNSTALALLGVMMGLKPGQIIYRTSDQVLSLSALQSIFKKAELEQGQTNITALVDYLLEACVYAGKDLEPF